MIYQIVASDTVLSFTSDYSVNGEGFELNWICYDQNDLVGTSGVISRPTYTDNEQLSWRVESECGESGVFIYSETFMIEFSHDILSIDNVLYSGIKEISQRVPSQFSVTFSSDASISDGGFVLHWECYTGNNVNPFSEGESIKSSRLFMNRREFKRT